jgi:hypothetical protein
MVVEAQELLVCAKSCC